MHYITTLYFAFLCMAVPETLSADFGDDATLNPFITPDVASAGDLEAFGDFPGGLSGDVSGLQPETSNILFDPGFDQYGEGVDSLATTYALDDCSVFNDQKLGKRIRAREAPALCSTEPKTSSDKQTGGDGNANGNEDLTSKNNDGFQTEPKNSLGLNRYGTNSDGTICPPDMWLLCSSVEPDMEGYCLGCYPCKFSGFASTLVKSSRRLGGQSCI